MGLSNSSVSARTIENDNNDDNSNIHTSTEPWWLPLVCGCCGTCDILRGNTGDDAERSALLGTDPHAHGDDHQRDAHDHGDADHADDQGDGLDRDGDRTGIALDGPAAAQLRAKQLVQRTANQLIDVATMRTLFSFQNYHLLDLTHDYQTMLASLLLPADCNPTAITDRIDGFSIAIGCRRPSCIAARSAARHSRAMAARRSIRTSKASFSPTSIGSNIIAPVIISGLHTPTHQQQQHHHGHHHSQQHGSRTIAGDSSAVESSASLGIPSKSIASGTNSSSPLSAATDNHAHFNRSPDDSHDDVIKSGNLHGKEVSGTNIIMSSGSEIHDGHSPQFPTRIDDIDRGTSAPEIGNLSMVEDTILSKDDSDFFEIGSNALNSVSTLAACIAHIAKVDHTVATAIATAAAAAAASIPKNDINETIVPINVIAAAIAALPVSMETQSNIMTIRNGCRTDELDTIVADALEYYSRRRTLVASLLGSIHKSDEEKIMTNRIIESLPLQFTSPKVCTSYGSPISDSEMTILMTRLDGAMLEMQNLNPSYEFIVRPPEL